jgi:hypothetical protein
MSSGTMISQNPNAHDRTLGTCWVVYGVFRLLAGALLFVFSGTATVMFGALLTQAPNPFTLMGIFHFTYMATIVLSALCGILGIIAGLDLLAAKQSARTLALIAGVLSLCDIPLGTTLGIYTLVALLPAARRESEG